MKKIIFYLFLILSGSLLSAIPAVDKKDIYSALSSDKEEIINSQLSLLKSATIPEKDAYEGALLMKKAGVINGTPKEKLALFKKGRAKLEASIAKDSNNVEYRFLRLIIQEHAPKILKYKSDIDDDAKVVSSNFKNFPDFLQKFVLDYSKTSKTLKLS